jgi:hypothetical protein
MPHGSDWFQIAGFAVAGYVMFRGVCVIINNTCVWILNKWGEGDSV